MDVIRTTWVSGLGHRTGQGLPRRTVFKSWAKDPEELVSNKGSGGRRSRKPKRDEKTMIRIRRVKVKYPLLPSPDGYGRLQKPHKRPASGSKTPRFPSPPGDTQGPVQSPGSSHSSCSIVHLHSDWSLLALLRTPLTHDSAVFQAAIQLYPDPLPSS